MPTISAIYTAAVKSLALQPRTSVFAGPAGIADDRRFHLIDGAGRLLTQRQRPQLAQVSAQYHPETDHLTLTFPDGPQLSAPVELGDPVRTPIWGRPIPGNVVKGQWNEALSNLCRGPVRLVKTANPNQSYDEYPLSLLSQASIDLLEQAANPPHPEQTAQPNHPEQSPQPNHPELVEGWRFDPRRFRPNFLLDGCAPHDEDYWLGGIIAIGPQLRLRLTAPDPRCNITAVNPDTGNRDYDTPRLLRTYRPSVRGTPYFGVYAAVETPGAASIGDQVEIVAPPPPR